MSEADLDDYVDLGAADDRVVRLDERAAVATVSDLDAVTRELLGVARDATTAERSAAYARAAQHYESALKHRLSLDYRD